MPSLAEPPRLLGAALVLALLPLLAAPVAGAEPGAAQAPPAPPVASPAPVVAPPAPLVAPAALVPQRLLASPLVTIERIDGGAVGAPADPRGWSPDGAEPPPVYLLDPDGFTTFGQVAPPEGGNLIMLVE